MYARIRCVQVCFFQGQFQIEAIPLREIDVLSQVRLLLIHHFCSLCRCDFALVLLRTR
jgi:hypothetical protein